MDRPVLTGLVDRYVTGGLDLDGLPITPGVAPLPTRLAVAYRDGHITLPDRVGAGLVGRASGSLPHRLANKEFRGVNTAEELVNEIRRLTKEGPAAEGAGLLGRYSATRFGLDWQPRPGGLDRAIDPHLMITDIAGRTELATDSPHPVTVWRAGRPELPYVLPWDEVVRVLSAYVAGAGSQTGYIADPHDQRHLRSYPETTDGGTVPARERLPEGSDWTLNLPDGVPASLAVALNGRLRGTDFSPTLPTPIPTRTSRRTYETEYERHKRAAHEPTVPITLPEAVRGQLQDLADGAPPAMRPSPKPKDPPTVAAAAAVPPAARVLPSYTKNGMFGVGAVERLWFTKEDGDATTLTAVVRDVLQQVAPEAVRDDDVSKVLNTLRPLNDMTGVVGARTLIDNLFGSGLKFAFVNKRAVLGAELVEVVIKASNIRDDRHLDHSELSGIENFAYANKERTQTDGKGSSFSVGATFAVGGGPALTRTVATGRLALGYTRRSAVTRTFTEVDTTTRTAMNWKGNDAFQFKFTVDVDAARYPMPRRPIANAATKVLGRQAPRLSNFGRRITGEMTWRIPTSLVDPANELPDETARPGRFQPPPIYYVEAVTGADDVLIEAQRAVGPEALLSATNNGQVVHWFLGSHAIRANFDEIISERGYGIDALLEPGVFEDLFHGVRLYGELHNPKRIRRSDSMALGLYLKHRKFFSAKVDASVNYGIAPGLGENSPISQTPLSAEGGQGAGVEAGMSPGQSTLHSDARPETHVKEVGPTNLVQAVLRLRIRGGQHRTNVFWTRTADA